MVKETRSDICCCVELAFDHLNIFLTLCVLAPYSAVQCVFCEQVRLTFKPIERQIWIGSAASTQKGACGLASAYFPSFASCIVLTHAWPWGSLLPTGSLQCILGHRLVCTYLINAPHPLWLLCSVLQPDQED